MKKLLAVSLALLMMAGCGKTASNGTAPVTGGVLTASWGDSRDSVKARLASVGDVRLALDSTDLVYTGGSYEGHTVATWVLSFGEQGELSSGRIIFEADSAGTETMVQGLETHLTGKYGAPAGAMTWAVKNASGETVSTLMLMHAAGQPVELRLEKPAAAAAQAKPATDTPSGE